MHKLERDYLQCAGPENIHTSPTEVHVVILSSTVFY